MLYRFYEHDFPEECRLGEIFNPSEYTELFVNASNKLELLQMPQSKRLHLFTDINDVQNRQERFDLVEKVKPNDMYIKIVPHDLDYPPILDYISNFDEVICIERKDLFDTILSGIISMNTWVFNVEQNEEKPKCEPFNASRSEFLFMEESIQKYFNYKNVLKNVITKTYVYEEFIKDEFAKNNFQKLSTLEQKRNIVKNWKEVYDWWENSWLYGCIENNTFKGE